MNDEDEIKDLPLPRLYRQVAVIYPTLDSLEPHYSWSLPEEDVKKIYDSRTDVRIDIPSSGTLIVRLTNL